MSQSPIDDKTLEIIMRVATRLAPRYTFGSYEVEDIVQEGVIIGMELLSSYDSEKPLENFLSISISNRLKNFKRDNYCRLEPNPKDDPEEWERWKNRDAVKKNILEPINFENVCDDRESNMSSFVDLLGEIEIQEIFALIDRELPVQYREDYLKLKRYYEGPKGCFILPKTRRAIIEGEIVKILKDNNYEIW